jgi:zinc transporter 1/2/3
MPYPIWKLIAGFIIFSLALIGGSIPLTIKITDTSKQWLDCGNAFAGGIFLGLGLIHLLPDAQSSLCATSIHSHYPLIFVVCAFSILLLRIIEESTNKLLLHKKYNNKILTPLLLSTLLSIHSILEGAALGIQSIFSYFFVIFMAISIHKGIAAFALGTNIRKNVASQLTMFSMMILFSIMTPIGICLGSLFSKCLSGEFAHLIEAIVDATVSGTFIYIAIFQTATLNNTYPSTPSQKYLVNFSLGLILIAIMGIWI